MPSFYPPVRGKSNNSNQSLRLYNNRLYYKYITDILYSQAGNNYIDLWYDVPFYGKVNTEGRLVMPKTELMTYSLSEGDLVTFPFFKTALEDYVFFLRRAATAGRTKLNLLLNNFVFKSSFVDAYLTQKQLTVGFTNIFNDTLLNQGKRVTNFNSYFCNLLSDIHTSRLNFSLFSAFSSSDITLRSTGLCFEFDQKNHDDDRTKNPYLQDEEFEKYVRTAANFGFRINKNAPWMIVADIASKPMLVGHTVKRSKRKIDVPGYLLSAFIPDIQTFFDQNYDRVAYRSFELFKESVIDGYNRYVENIIYYYDHGTSRIETQKSFKNITGIGITRQEQNLIYIKDYDETLYDDYYFLKKYEQVIKSESEKNIKNSNYLSFKISFDKMIKLKKPVNDILDEIEKFYIPTRVYVPETGKLFWNSPKKPLTSVNDYGMIQTKDQPTIGKIVTEFMPDL